jgi:hypothetical protein
MRRVPLTHPTLVQNGLLQRRSVVPDILGSGCAAIACLPYREPSLQRGTLHEVANGVVDVGTVHVGPMCRNR